jgi:hypothetical protein
MHVSPGSSGPYINMPSFALRSHTQPRHSQANPKSTLSLAVCTSTNKLIKRANCLNYERSTDTICRRFRCRRCPDASSSAQSIQQVHALRRRDGAAAAVELSGEGGVMDPRCRFYLEPSKEHDGLMHVRCCYNNKCTGWPSVSLTEALAGSPPMSRRRTCPSPHAPC